MFDKPEITSQETLMGISISENEGKEDGGGGGDTPPLPPRASTPVSEGEMVGVIRYPLIPPPLYPLRPRSRTRHHFT